jgi:hypothetical protein
MGKVNALAVARVGCVSKIGTIQHNLNRSLLAIGNQRYRPLTGAYADSQRQYLAGRRKNVAAPLKKIARAGAISKYSINCGIREKQSIGFSAQKR